MVGGGRDVGYRVDEGRASRIDMIIELGRGWSSLPQTDGGISRYGNDRVWRCEGYVSDLVHIAM